jgi:hypothetical protein
MKVPHGIVEWRLKIESAERRAQRAERERIKRYAPCSMRGQQSIVFSPLAYVTTVNQQSTVNNSQ